MRYWYCSLSYEWTSYIRNSDIPVEDCRCCNCGSQCEISGLELIGEAAARWRTHARPVFADIRVGVVVYCFLRNVDPGCFIFI